jgi:hypothetical protein
VNSFKPLPVDLEKRRQAMWVLRGDGWNFYNLARAFGTSLTEARQAVDPKHHTPQRTFLCDEEGR